MFCRQRKRTRSTFVLRPKYEATISDTIRWFSRPPAGFLPCLLCRACFPCGVPFQRFYSAQFSRFCSASSDRITSLFFSSGHYGYVLRSAESALSTLYPGTSSCWLLAGERESVPKPKCPWYPLNVSSYQEGLASESLKEIVCRSLSGEP